MNATTLSRLAELHRELAAEFASAAAAAGAAATGRDELPDFWTSGLLPPECPSRRAFATQCRAIAEARRCGRGWVCPRAAWDEAVERRRLSRRKKTASNVVALRPELADVVAALTVGTRATRRDAR